MTELTSREVKALIDQAGPSLGYDYTYEPVFPKGRKDVCAVRRMAENDGSTYGFDTIYLVWKEPDGSLKHTEIKNSRATKDYIFIDSIKVNEDGSVSVKFGSGGNYSGTPWSESMKVAFGSGQAQVQKETPNSFSEQAKQAMAKVVENHQHHHSLYLPTAVKESVIDENRKIAAFILFEQIDSDRLTPKAKDVLLEMAEPGHPLQTFMPEDVTSEGWLGDQFRYSLWLMKEGQEPVQLYEDHAYIRLITKNELTGTRGRDCSLKNLKIEGNVVKVTHLKGERVEEQKPEELIFKF